MTQEQAIAISIVKKIQAIGFKVNSMGIFEMPFGKGGAKTCVAWVYNKDRKQKEFVFGVSDDFGIGVLFGATPSTIKKIGVNNAIQLVQLRYIDLCFADPLKELLAD